MSTSTLAGPDAFASQFAAAHRRAVLEVLAAQPGSAANDATVVGLLSGLGILISHEEAREHLAWLGERGLVEPHQISDHLLVATLTQRGLDACEGRLQVDGVQRRPPGGLTQLGTQILGARLRDTLGG